MPSSIFRKNSIIVAIITVFIIIVNGFDWTFSWCGLKSGYVRAGQGDVLYFDIFDGDRMRQFVDCGAGNGLFLAYICKLRRERNKGHLEAHAVEMDAERCQFIQGMVDSGDRALQSTKIHNLDWTDSKGGGLVLVE